MAGQIQITASNFVSNYAINGAAVSLQAHAAIAAVTDCFFHKNQADEAAAGIVGSSTLTVSNSYFLSNSGVEYGSLFMMGSSPLHVLNTKASNIPLSDILTRVFGCSLRRTKHSTGQR